MKLQWNPSPDHIRMILRQKRLMKIIVNVLVHVLILTGKSVYWRYEDSFQAKQCRKDYFHTPAFAVLVMLIVQQTGPKTRKAEYTIEVEGWPNGSELNLTTYLERQHIYTKADEMVLASMMLDKPGYIIGQKSPFLSLPTLRPGMLTESVFTVFEWFTKPSPIQMRAKVRDHPYSTITQNRVMNFVYWCYEFFVSTVSFSVNGPSLCCEKQKKIVTRP